MTKTVCLDCIEDAFLKSEIARIGSLAVCSYCEEEGSCISVDVLADYVEKAISSHYCRTSDNPSDFEYMLIKESDYEWERAGDPISSVIAMAAGIDDDIAEEVRVILHSRTYDWDDALTGMESPFDAGSQYEESECSEGAFSEKWDRFKSKLNTEARYFSRELLSILDDVFDGLEGHTTSSGASVVVDAGPGKNISSLYRSRIFQADDEKLKKALVNPDIEIGPPQPRYAKSGRMNAQGVPVFYGSIDFNSAIAEVRPPVGSRVAVMRFDIIRPIKLLDMTGLDKIKTAGSVFDPKFLEKLQRAKFLSRLQELMTRIVLPDDEGSEYLVTQAVAGYLAVEKRLDGIIYPSAQSANHANNVVLFSHAAIVEKILQGSGRNVSAETDLMTEEGPEIWYSVSEKVPQGPNVKSSPPDNTNTPIATLRHNWAEFYVFHVVGATFHGDTHRVSHSIHASH